MSIFQSISMSVIHMVILVLMLALRSISDVHSISLNKMKKHINSSDIQVHRDSPYSSRLIETIDLGLMGNKTINSTYQIELTVNAIARNPCLIVKLASYFDDSRVRVIASKKLIPSLDDIHSCTALYGRHIQKTIVYIAEDENSFRGLKNNYAMQFLTREIRCYVVICPEVCTSLILQIAQALGFGLGIYFWITIAPVSLKYELDYPKNVFHLAVMGDSLQSIKSNAVRGLLKATFSLKSIASLQEDKALLELTFSQTTGKYSFLYNYQSNLFNEKPAFNKRTELKAVMTTGIDTKSHPDYLDSINMICMYGILCWVYPVKNGIFGRTREPSCCLGFLMDILLRLETDLNISFYVYEVENREWGFEVNGTWNGVIGDLASGRADIAAEWIVVDHSLLSIVDFTESYLVDDVVLASIIQESPLPYLNLEAFASLTFYSWISILSVTLMTGGIIYLAERLVYLRSSMGNVCNIVTYAMGLLFQRDIGGLLPNHLGSRMISVALAMALMVVMTTYTAVLTTRNIENRKAFTISGMDDAKVIHPSPAYKIGTYTFYSYFFEKHSKVKMRRLGEFMKSYNFYETFDAYEEIKKGNLHAAIVDRSALEIGWKSEQYCDFNIVENVFRKSIAFSLGKGSHWKEPISDLILGYKRQGILDGIKQRYMTSHCTEKHTNQSKQFGILYLSGACILLAAGFILSVFFFVLEHLINACVKILIKKRT